MPSPRKLSLAVRRLLRHLRASRADAAEGRHRRTDHTPPPPPAAPATPQRQPGERTVPIAAGRMRTPPYVLPGYEPAGQGPNGWPVIQPAPQP